MRLRLLLDWLGIERTQVELDDNVAENSFEAIPAAQKGPGTQRRAASPGLWRENMTAQEQRMMNEIMRPKLEELGYEA